MPGAAAIGCAMRLNTQAPFSQRHSAACQYNFRVRASFNTLTSASFNSELRCHTQKDGGSVRSPCSAAGFRPSQAHKAMRAISCSGLMSEEMAEACASGESIVDGAEKSGREFLVSILEVATYKTRPCRLLKH